MIRHGGQKINLTDEQKKDTFKKNLKLKKLMKEFFKFRRNWRKSDKSSEELFEYSSELMFFGTDCPSIFGFRKDILLEELKEKDIDSVFKYIEKELQLLTKLGLADPKSYEVWQHRRWTLEQAWIIDHNRTRFLIEKDMILTDMYLTKDPRNFHVWNYRHELVEKVVNVNPIFELTQQIVFVRQKILKDFSNHSAIHFFIQYSETLAGFSSIDGQVNFKEIEQEYKRNLQALFVSPVEQSLWLFQKWLMKGVISNSILAATRESFGIKFLLRQPLNSSAFPKAFSFIGIDPLSEKTILHGRNAFEVFIRAEFLESSAVQFQSKDLLTTITVENGKLKFEVKGENAEEQVLLSTLELVSEIEPCNKESEAFKVSLINSINLLMEFKRTVLPEDELRVRLILAGKKLVEELPIESPVRKALLKLLNRKDDIIICDLLPLLF